MAKKILNVNPYSVPGFWLQALAYLQIGDTSSAKGAYDNAILSMKNKSDPLMPDSSNGAISSFEADYRDYCRRHLSAERAALGP